MTDTKPASATPSVLIVTGATGALGSAVVHHFAERGHTIAAVERPSSVARLSEVARAHKRVRPVELAESTPEGWKNVIARVAAEIGAPSGAVLTAGGYAGGTRLFEDEGEAIWRRMIEQNLDSARLALAGLLPAMVAAGRGSVVLVGSRAAVRPWDSPGAAAYATSKAALVALAQAVAAEVLGDGVRVNVVLPSVIDTEANRKNMPAADPSTWVSRESLCDVIAFLLSDAARDVSGAALPVYGRA
jgi:NAD(P)-dependent dehydrogenase (short-subunit alcohol dehydrogenase family)